jgi:MYXO-CTERM domain-containing protein
MKLLGCTTTALALLLFARASLAANVPVTNATELAAAIAAAKADDHIILANGTYAFTSSPSCSASGTAATPIVVSAATPLGAKVTFDTVEGFKVSGANWRFEGLDVHGICANDSACEHAFHVTGAAHGFALRGNRIVDFNAQLKVNAAAPAGGGAVTAPNDGLIENNELFDTHARNTSNPTTKLNIDSGDRWIVRANRIHDFQKGGGDGVSYAAFLKSGGHDGLFERNLVVCSTTAGGGTRIGLSFGGGGTGAQFCAPAFNPNVPCDVEHTNGTMRNNIIASCSDVGIYLNRSKGTKLLFNTLVATNGIDFRFATTTGIAVGNVLAGAIRARDGGTFTPTDNLENVTSFAAWYQAPAIGDLRKKGDLSSLLGKSAVRTDVVDDYCLRPRKTSWDLGALQASLGDCDTLVPPPGSGGPDGGAPDGGADGGGTSGGGGSSGTSGGASSGSPGDGGDAAPSDGSSSGCGCRTSAPAATGWGAAGFLGLAALIARRRRSRS